MLAHADVSNINLSNNDLSNKELSNNNENQLKSGLFNASLDELASITAESIQNYVSKIKTLTKITYDGIAALSSEPSEPSEFSASSVSFEFSEGINFASVIQPLIDLSIYTEVANTLCTFPMHVHAEKEVRDASAEACEELDKLKIECEQRNDVFKVFEQYESEIYPREKSDLHFEECRYIEEMANNYKRNGLYISDDSKKERINQIKNLLSELCIQFEKNLNEENTSFTMKKDELAGMPEDWFTAEREVAPGEYKVTLQYPDVHPILDNVSYRPTREKIYLAFNGRCEKENMPILKQILELRAELASLLGYATHAEFAAEERMVKDAKTIDNFLKDMDERFTPLLQDNLKGLTEFAIKKENDSNFILQAHDMRYYTRAREEEHFNIDMNEIKKYFATKKVIKGTLEIYANLLGLEFIQNEKTSAWHVDVMTYDVLDGQTREKLGHFNLDLHPRQGKYGHAAVFPHLNGCDISHLTRVEKDRSPNVVAMVCNFPKEGNITFKDAQTFFHEFGHVMHFICSKTKLSSNHGDHIETDFVEAPSQMLENWCFEPQALNLLSEHPETHQPLPQDMAQKLHDKEIMHAGYFNKRQLVFGHFDFLIHNMSLEKIKDLDIKLFYQQLLSQILQLPASRDDCFPASFGHLIGGYDVGYYGYLMSKTYAADMFATIFKNDPMSAESGMKYRREILEPGCSQDADLLLQNFLGRAPNMDAFLEDVGLKKSKDEKDEFVKIAQGVFVRKGSEIPSEISSEIPKDNSVIQKVITRYILDGITPKRMHLNEIIQQINELSPIEKESLVNNVNQTLSMIDGKLSQKRCEAIKNIEKNYENRNLIESGMFGGVGGAAVSAVSRLNPIMSIGLGFFGGSALKYADGAYKKYSENQIWDQREQRAKLIFDAIKGEPENRRTQRLS
jgi:thimet oligopeptidase